MHTVRNIQVSFEIFALASREKERHSPRYSILRSFIFKSYALLREKFSAVYLAPWDEVERERKLPRRYFHKFMDIKEDFAIRWGIDKFFKEAQASNEKTFDALENSKEMRNEHFCINIVID